MKIIPISGKNGTGKFALVDDDDYGRLSNLKWFISDKGYAIRSKHVKYENGKQIKETVKMHRLVMNTPYGLDTDHINHNKLDNRKENLRVCTRTQNSCNSNQKVGVSGFRGVHKSGNKWLAMIKIPNKRLYLGTYGRIEDAVSAYDAAAKKYHGEFSVVNK